MEGQLFTVSEAARYLEISYGKVRAWALSEKLGRVTVGGAIILTGAEVKRIRELKRPVGRPSKTSTEKGVPS